MSREKDVVGGSAWVVVVFFGGLFGGAGVNLLLPLPVLPGIWTRVLGSIPMAAGIGLFAWSRAAFRRRGTPIKVQVPTSALVQDGPYAFSRNPIYLSFIIIYVGWAFIFDSSYVLAMLLVVFVFFDRKVISREEQYLEARFGDEYRSYKSRVRRWI
jgi:protein-S-isoprenylcysteine O-methyltransferase Ste14